MSRLLTPTPAEQFTFLIHELLVPFIPGIQCPATFAALCRVSKEFRAIFTPILYQYLYIELGYRTTSLHHLSALVDPSSLRFTKEVYLTTPNNHRRDDAEDEKRIQSLDRLLQHTTSLTTFTLFGPALLGLYSRDDDGGGEDTTIPPLIRLSQLAHLTSVTIGNSADGPEFKTLLPTFRNLLRFDLYGLARLDDMYDIVETLVASPNLEYFGLSLAAQTYLDNTPLRELIDWFERRQAQLNSRSPLRLSGLRLGFGTIPTQWEVGYPQEEDTYLQKLTDLSFLRDLRLDNSNGPGQADHFHTRNIDTDQFLMAKSVQRLSVDILTVQALELVKMFRDVENPCLDELEVSRYFETLSPDANYGIDPNDDDERDFGDGDGYTPRNIYSLNLERTGYYWRHLSIGTKVQKNYASDRSRAPSQAQDLLQNFVVRCEGLEELSFPLIESQIDLFKETVMFKTRKNLRAIFLPRDYLADFRPPIRTAYYIAQAGGEEKFDLNSAKVIREQAEMELKLAGELFKRNRELVVSDGACLLQYVGIADLVYSCHVAPQDAVESPSIFSTAETKYQIFKIPPRQALKFKAVKRRYWERFAKF